MLSLVYALYAASIYSAASQDNILEGLMTAESSAPRRTVIQAEYECTPTARLSLKYSQSGSSARFDEAALLAKTKIQLPIERINERITTESTIVNVRVSCTNNHYIIRFTAAPKGAPVPQDFIFNITYSGLMSDLVRN